MNVRADFDVGPLSWVKGEIDLAMQRGLEALRAFTASPADATRIRQARAHYHQALGALEIVGLAGVARVYEELEGLLGDLEQAPAVRTPQNYAVAEEATGGIIAYLDSLMAGSQDRPLRLFPVYRKLLAARGRADADPVDLYFPDFSATPPKRESAPARIAPEDLDKHFREQRARFQRGMLRSLKGDAGGAGEMLSAVEAIEQAQEASSQHAFWWVALAFLDALAAKALPGDIDGKRMCNRIEQQIRRLVEGSQGVVERLMREVLYCSARATPASDRIRAVQELYQLARTLPTEDEGKSRAPEPAALKPAREALALAKDAWNKYASGNPPSLIAFRSACGVLKDRCAELGTTQVAALAREIAVLATWLSGSGSKMSEAIALEVATALLLLENSLANLASLGTDFAHQSEFMCSRLKDCVLGRLLRTAPTIPLLDEMSRKAQERLLLSQVVAEMQANLRVIEQTLDAYFRDASRRDELAGLGGPLRQVRGALDMLGETRARDSLAGCEVEINMFSRPDYTPQKDDFERIAQTLSGMGFYIEGLGVGKADFDAAMRPIAPRRPPEEASVQPTVEAQLAQQKREAQSLIREWKKKPTDTWLKAELQKNLAAIQKDASLVADAALEGQAQAALRVLERTSDEAPLEPKVAQALEAAVPERQSPLPTPETTKLIDASAGKIDAELLEVFLEEADEVLTGVGEHLELLRAHPTDRPALTATRRAFHTLKGSGRMVGLMRLGEAAWAVEQTINLWLQEERTATPDLLSLISVTHEYFADNVARLKHGGTSSDEGALVELAAQVRRREPLALEAARVQAGIPAISGAPAAPALPETPATPSIPAAAEEFVVIGGEQVSRSLLAVFESEARSRLEVMAQEREVLIQQAVISDALIRAAHTLAGISATVRIDAARELAQAFEQALQKLATMTLSEAEEQLVGAVIEALDAMVSDGSVLRAPQARPDLIERLRRATIPVLVETTESILLPEEEGAIVREPQAPLPAPAERAKAESLAAAETAPAKRDIVEQISMDRRQARMRDDIDPQLLPVFLEEVSELMPAIGSAVREWRGHREDPAIGQRIQRLLHTLKGSARMAGAMAVGELTHHMESRVENGLAMKTRPDAWFDVLETSYDRLGALVGLVSVRAPAEAVPPDAPPRAAAQALPRTAEVPAAVPEVPFQAAMLRVRTEVVDRLVNQAGEVSIARSRIEGEMRALRAAMQDLTDNVTKLRSQLREIEIHAESQMQSRMQEIRDAKQQFDPLEFDRFTRFQELTRLMAESVNDVQTVHQTLLNAVDQTEVGLLAQARLNRDLQQDLMRVRMVPFASLSERLYRIVRQTAKELGKRVNLDIRGAQVDLDRSVLERITGPIEHMLRNAVTHGIEAPAERVARGKPEFGDIRLEVTQEGNDVRFALADDGRGLDIDRIRTRALATGLTGPDSRHTDAELADFIFLPGFSTAEMVTEVAGRGVGMDVVRTEVSALGGRIELDFQKDKGTGFTIYLPLTLAVTQAVLVRGLGRAYAIPAVMVEQVQQLKADRIAAAHASHQAEWQARRYPFHYLPQLLGTPGAQPEPRRYAAVLFLRSGSNAIALHVDEIAGSNQEIVVKPIGPQLQRVPGIAGATVLGSGEIALIINPVLLALREAAAPAAAPAPATQVPLLPVVMVVDDSLTVRKITGRLLAREGYDVIVAKDGVEAMEKLQEAVPDVMLVDIEMPRMDGFDLTRNVRADPRLVHIPIIMITSRTAEKHQGYAREIGANLFLGKPFQEEELLGHIAGFVKAGRGTRSP